MTDCDILYRSSYSLHSNPIPHLLHIICKLSNALLDASKLVIMDTVSIMVSTGVTQGNVVQGIVLGAGTNGHFGVSTLDILV